MLMCGILFSFLWVYLLAVLCKKVFSLATSLWQQDTRRCMDVFGSIGKSLIVAAFSTIIGLGLVVVLVSNPLVPDIGIAMTERDQLATLLIGIATLGCTAVYIICWRKNKKTRKEDIEELQTRIGAVYNGLASARVTEI
jgi:hypothetical protein